MLNKDSKILIVDDSQSVRGMVTQFFAKKMGIPENNLVEAENGALGFEEMTKHPQLTTRMKRCGLSASMLFAQRTASIKT